jgi:hypothetical protein
VERRGNRRPARLTPLAHIPTCKRTPDTYDLDCPRCRELSDLAASYQRDSGLDEPGSPEQHDNASGEGCLAVFKVAFFVVIAAIVLGTIYLLVRFVKWSWQG